MRSDFQTAVAQTVRRTSLGLALHLVLLLSIFSAAIGIRAWKIRLLPLEFHPVRQYRSAFIAKAFYYQGNPSIPEWKKDIAARFVEREGILEPPILEHLGSLSYRIVGKERVWIPRFFSAIFWVVGGAFLYLLARDAASSRAAIFSTTFYLFLPFGVAASRSFQPDPMMVMALLLSVYLVFRYYHRESWQLLALAACAAAAAMLIKPVCLFLIFGAFVLLAFSKQGIWKSFRNPRIWAFGAISLVPSVIYYAHGILSGGRLESQAEGTFFPRLFFERQYWLGWLGNIDRVTGVAIFILALLGILLFRPGMPRALMVGLWAGYFLFGLVFNYHIHTHDYYQLQLIPVVALSLGPMADTLFTDLMVLVAPGWGGRVALTALLLLGALLATASYIQAIWDPVYWVNRDQVTISEEVGRRVNHTNRALLLSYAYGDLLEYHGDVYGIPWPWKNDLDSQRRLGQSPPTLEGLFQEMSQKYSPEYFIITEMAEYDRQPDLQNFLTKNYPLFARGDRYLIFDLRKRLSANP
jgi:Dolichyl-phosphate-mannose-protein mannosyltransferase